MPQITFTLFCSRLFLTRQTSKSYRARLDCEVQNLDNVRHSMSTLKKHENRSIGLLAYQFKTRGLIAELRELSSSVKIDASLLDVGDAKTLLSIKCSRIEWRTAPCCPRSISLSKFFWVSDFPQFVCDKGDNENTCCEYDSIYPDNVVQGKKHGEKYARVERHNSP